MDGVLDLEDRRQDIVEKARPGIGQAHTHGRALEQGNPDAVLKIPDAAADGGDLDIEGQRHLAEAEQFRGGQDIADCPEIERQTGFRPLNRALP